MPYQRRSQPKACQGVPCPHNRLLLVLFLHRLYQQHPTAAREQGLRALTLVLREARSSGQDQGDLAATVSLAANVDKALSCPQSADPSRGGFLALLTPPRNALSPRAPLRAPSRWLEMSACPTCGEGVGGGCACRVERGDYQTWSESGLVYVWIRGVNPYTRLTGLPTWSTRHISTTCKDYRHGQHALGRHGWWHISHGKQERAEHVR
jgi:hypothetical protein